MYFIVILLKIVLNIKNMCLNISILHNNIKYCPRPSIVYLSVIVEGIVFLKTKILKTVDLLNSSRW